MGSATVNAVLAIIGIFVLLILSGIMFSQGKNNKKELPAHQVDFNRIGSVKRNN